MNNDDEEHLSTVALFKRFFEDSDADGYYHSAFQESLEKETNRLVVDLDHLRQFDPFLTNNLMRRPIPYIRAFETALTEMASAKSDDAGKTRSQDQQFR